MFKNIKRNWKIIWLRFKKNCYRGSINYADKKLKKKFDRTLYDQRKKYKLKLQVIDTELFNIRRF